MLSKIGVKANVEKKATEKKYLGVYAMGDAPIVVRGLIKALDRLDLDGVISGVNPRNGGEKLAVMLAVALHDIFTNGIDVKELAKVAKTIDGERKLVLTGRGEAQWEELAINEIISQFLATATTAEPKKSKGNKK